MDFNDKGTRQIIFAILLTIIICTVMLCYTLIQRSNYNRYDFLGPGSVFDTKTGKIIKPIKGN